jgi:hypothetical protein
MEKAKNESTSSSESAANDTTSDDTTSAASDSSDSNTPPTAPPTKESEAADIELLRNLFQELKFDPPPAPAKSKEQPPMMPFQELERAPGVNDGSSKDIPLSSLSDSGVESSERTGKGPVLSSNGEPIPPLIHDMFGAWFDCGAQPVRGKIKNCLLDNGLLFGAKRAWEGVEMDKGAAKTEVKDRSKTKEVRLD